MIGARGYTRTMTLSSRPLLFFAFALLACIGLTDNIRGPLLPEIIQTFSVPHTAAALIFSLSAWASVPGCLLAGWGLRRRSAVTVVRYGACLMLCGLVGMATAPWWTLLLASCVVYGMGAAICHVGLNLLVAQAAPPAGRARLVSWFQVMYGVASFGAPFWVTVLRPWCRDWSGVIGLTALLPLGLLVWAQWRIDAVPPHAAEEASAERDWIAAAWRDPRCRFFCGIMGVYATSELILSMWLVLYLEQGRGLTPIAARAYLAGFFACMALVRLCGGPWFHRARVDRLLAGAAAWACVMTLVGIFWHPVGWSLSALGFGVLFPVGVAAFTTAAGTQAHAQLSVVFTVMFLIVGLGQLAMGWLSDHYTIRAAIWLPVVLIGSVAWLWRRHGHLMHAAPVSQRHQGGELS